MAAAEENITNIANRRSLVAVCRFAAAVALAAHTRASVSGVCEVTTASSKTPAACTTPVNGCAGSTLPEHLLHHHRIADIPRHHRHPRPQLAQPPDQLLEPRRLQTATTDQQQTPDLPHAHHMRRHQGAPTRRSPQ